MMSTEKFTNVIFALDDEFDRRFANFKKLLLNLILYHHRLQPNLKKTPDAVQLELFDLLRDSNFKKKFQSENIDKFYAFLNTSNYVKMVVKLLVVFGFTYICEQTFFTMNTTKLTYVHMRSLLRISTSNMQPD